MIIKYSDNIGSISIRVTGELIFNPPTFYLKSIKEQTSINEDIRTGIIQQKLQLPQKPTWLAEFDGNQLIDDIRIPNGKYMGAEYKEVLCKSFPEIKGLKLEGGGSQFITNSQIKVNRLINLETGEIIKFSH